MTSKEKRRRSRIRRMVADHPSEVLDALLEQPFWPNGLNAMQGYQRRGDDDDSHLRVTISQDGDVWPDVFQVEMAHDPKSLGTPRYRTYFGGGESLRTRNAVLMLAAAIMKDNAERPQ